MKEFVRKTFWTTLEIPKIFLFFKRKKKISINIPQATVWEAIKFLESETNWQNPMFWIIPYLETCRGKDFSKSEKIYLMSNIDSMLEIREKTFLYGFDNTKNIKWSTKVGWSPYSSFRVFLAKETCTPINVIFNELTYEQVRAMAEWITRNSNQATPEGELRNKAYEHQEVFMKENDMDEINRLLKE